MSEQRDKNITDLVRELLKGVNLDAEDLDKIVNETDEKERNEFLAKVNSVYTNGVVFKIIDNLVKKQIEFSILEAENMEQVSFGRATIYGLTLLKEELERFNALYNEQVKPKDEYEKAEII
jgi:hypothetical protein